MEGDTYSGLVNGAVAQIDGRVLHTFQKSFVQVQNILEQNRLLIQEINQNHESRIPEKLSRNVGLIRELNNNIRRVVDLYADLSHSFAKSADGEGGGDNNSSGGIGIGIGGGGLRASSDGRIALKRTRPN